MTERFYQTLLSVMEQNVREHDRIFIDTCSLLDAGADKFWMKIIPFLYKYGKYIVVAVRVYQEVQKFAFDATYAQRKGKLFICRWSCCLAVGRRTAQYRAKNQSYLLSKLHSQNHRITTWRKS